MENELYILLKYFGVLLADEEPLNIWLALLPDEAIREHVYAVGQYIVALLGGA